MKLTKKHIIIISAIILVLLGGLVAFWIWQAQGGRFFVTPDSSRTKKDVPQYTQDKQQDLVDEVNKKSGQGDYNGAIELIEGQENASDPEMQLLLAAAYANAEKYDKALEIYKELDSKGELPDVKADTVAAIAERAGDNQLALDMYKRAKEYSISSGENNQDQIDYYDYKIAALEKKS